MPLIMDWMATPLQIVDDIFHRHRASDQAWHKSVLSFFEDKLQSVDRHQIPYLNDTPNYNLVSGQLVRFQGIIQDMFDPEIFLSEFCIRNKATGESKMATCCFRESSDLTAKEEIDLESDLTRNSERLPYFCVAVPGESAWASEGRKQQSTQNQSLPSTSNDVRMKRSLEDDSQLVSEEPAQDSGATKKCRSSVPVPGSAHIQQPTLNQGVIVKLYNWLDGALILNDMVEFVGILSLDPPPPSIKGDDSGQVSCQFDLINEFEQKEMEAKNPPCSLVPRLHVLTFSKLVHNNPLVTSDQFCINELQQARSELKDHLTHMLLGDSLAAEYLICHLVCKIYIRRDVFCLGKYSLNLFNIPTSNTSYGKNLALKLAELLTTSQYVALTVDNLNKLSYVPKKDYEANRLLTGMLQLAQNTHLILDETVMEKGQLTSDGVSNLQALGNLIKWQKVDYNFSFHPLSFDCDIPCLILSEGRSMLPSDITVMLQPQAEVANVHHDLSSESLLRIRRYLTIVRHFCDFELNDQMQQFVEDDFVAERRTSDGQVSPDDLHGLLILARLVSVSHAMTSFNQDLWRQVKEMERERKQRMAHLPSRA